MALLENCFYFYQLTFPELLAIRSQKNGPKAAISITGESHFEANPNSLWAKWQKEVDAVANGRYPHHSVPSNVMEYFNSTKFCNTPPTAGQQVLSDPFAPPANFRPPKFSWSLTALQDFENCPRAYAEKRFFKRVKDKPFDAQDYGNRLHKTAEDYANHLKRCAESNNPAKTDLFDPDLLKIVKPYCDQIVAASAGGELYIEHELNFTRDFKSCSATDWDRCWYRGKSDVSLIKGDTCYVYDFKSGKIKDDPTQLELMNACEALLFLNVQKFVGRYIWLAHNQVSAPVVLERKDLVGVWKSILARVKRMEEACQAQVFQAKTSGLCKKYCPVLSCPHNGLR